MQPKVIIDCNAIAQESFYLIGTSCLNRINFINLNKIYSQAVQNHGSVLTLKRYKTRQIVLLFEGS